MKAEENENLESIEEEVEAQAESAEASSDQSGTKADEEQARVQALEAESKENYDKYLRTVAELENFKKRSTKERSEMLRYAGEYLAGDLLNVLDDLERATSQENPGTIEEILEGIGLIKTGFTNVLKKHSVEAMDSVGKPFDPNTHEALTTVQTDEHPAGVVIEQFKKAYYFKDKLLRPAQVVVSAAKPQSEEQ